MSRQIRLHSNAMIYTPGMIKNMQHMTKTGDEELALKILCEGYHIDPYDASRILHEEDCLVEFVEDSVHVTFFNSEGVGNV